VAAKITAEIDAGGPITFARFMELALYDPEGGYYTGAESRPGRAGDFITAPEAHPIFGWALARQVHQLWELLDRPDPFVIREHGAGTGALILGILEGLAREAAPLLAAVRYQPVEVEPRRTDALAERLDAAGHAARLDLDREAAATPVTGLVLANEVLDALPVHRVRGLAGGGIEELFVAHRGAEFEEVAGPPSTRALEARLAAEGITLRPGQQAEVCLALDGWIRSAAAELRRGLLLLIDYGHPAAELYDPVRRPRGTLLAYQHHRAVDNPFQSVGRQDLTAHVDMTVVEAAANGAGLVTAGITTQSELLVSLGAGDLLAGSRDRPGATVEGYLAARAALVRMLDPAAMGRFRVMLFARGLPPDARLKGLEFRLPAR
jgi:SAM-dependent MidA family methyltransferase